MGRRLSMRKYLTDADRWNWYAAGDETIAPRAVVAPAEPNSTNRVFWEMGLVFVVPLLVAVVSYALPF
jgi:hypothetical protein